MRRIIFAPITFPISLLLDKWLGRDIGTVYSQEELKRLMYVAFSLQHLIIDYVWLATLACAQLESNQTGQQSKWVILFCHAAISMSPMLMRKLSLASQWQTADSS